MNRLLCLLLMVPSGLAAQREPGPRPEPFYRDTAGPTATRGYSFGIVGYTGGQWQPSGVELGLLWRLSARALTNVGASLTLGSFTQDQAVYLGRSQGFFAAAGLSLRQPVLDLAVVGSERNPAYIKLETALDAGWSADFNSPLPQGPSDIRAALLGGISFGTGTAMGQTIYIMYGPSALIGRTTTTHGEFVLRFRAPVGRR
jgi:hypothetical protein